MALAAHLPAFLPRSAFRIWKTNLLRKQIRFFDSLTAGISTIHGFFFFAFIKQVRASRSFPPLQESEFVKARSWFRSPVPWLSLSVSAILSRHPLSCPTLFFRGLPRRREGGTKVKRKHSERVRCSHFPQGVRRRPECGVKKIGRGGGKLFPEGAQELTGSVLGCEASPTSGKADMDTISILLGKCGLGLEV